jgi:hypothetical protein
VTTTNIHNWKGIEFSKEFVDFTITGMLEAKATGSVQTGRMVRSVKMRKILDGFSVYADRNEYPPTSRGRDRYYVNTYMFKGYKYHPKFPFIFTAFDTVGDSEQLVDSTSGFYGTYKAMIPSGRRGAGTARYNSSDTASGRQYLAVQGRKNTVKIPRRIAK